MLFVWALLCLCFDNIWYPSWGLLLCGNDLWPLVASKHRPENSPGHISTRSKRINFCWTPWLPRPCAIWTKPFFPGLDPSETSRTSYAHLYPWEGPCAGASQSWSTLEPAMVWGWCHIQQRWVPMKVPATAPQSQPAQCKRAAPAAGVTAAEIFVFGFFVSG